MHMRARDFLCFAECVKEAQNRLLLLGALKQEDHFAEAFKQCTGAGQLSSWFYAFFDHLNKVKELLKTLADVTDEDHAEHRRFERAHRELNEVINEINELVRKNEEMAELRRRDKSLCGKSAGFVREGRRIIQEGGMLRLDSNIACSNLASFPSSLGSEPRRATHHLILCNDTLWYCEVLRGLHGERYKVMHIFQLTEDVPISAKMVGDTEGVFSLADAATQEKLRALQGMGARAWVDAIEQAVSNAPTVPPVARSLSDGTDPHQRELVATDV